MATKQISEKVYSKEGALTVITATATIGGSGAPTLVTTTGHSKGVTSIVHNSAGNYTITLDNTYSQFRGILITRVKSDGAISAPATAVIAEDVASAKTINFETMAATITGTEPSETVGYVVEDPSSGSTLHIVIFLNDTVS